MGAKEGEDLYACGWLKVVFHSCTHAPQSSTHLYFREQTQKQSASLWVIFLYFAKSVRFVTLQMIKAELPQNHPELITYLKNICL